MDKIATSGGVIAAGIGSFASVDEVQSVLVALMAIIVREVIYWWRNRRKETPESAVS